MIADTEPSQKFRADVIIECDQYASGDGTLSSFFRARWSRGLVLEWWLSKGGDKPYLAGTYRVDRKKLGRGYGYSVHWAPKGNSRMEIKRGDNFDKIVAIAKVIAGLTRWPK